ncbi:hypothetical protein glysoja_010064 [Glycine soja]|nr:hypothetical protein glysoja_010064 [Glycine soja]
MSSMALDARSVMSESDVCKCFFTNWGSTTRDFHRLHTHLNCSGLLTLIQTRISIIRRHRRHAPALPRHHHHGNDDAGFDSGFLVPGSCSVFSFRYYIVCVVQVFCFDPGRSCSTLNLGLRF